MSKLTTQLFIYYLFQHFVDTSYGVIYTYEDVELRRIFPSEFPQDTIRKTGSPDPEPLGRYAELKNYFRYPKSNLNSHFEELVCYNKNKKKLVALCLVVVVAEAASPPRINYDTKNVEITEFENDNLGFGNYRYGYAQSDGQRAQQSGQLKNEGREDESLSVTGSYTWVGPDGVTYVVTYTADEEGYKPEIEQGPGGGVPPAVVASLLG